jgi:hypothetical protein
MLGNGRLEAMCFDGVKRLCHIRGKLRKKVGSVTNIMYAFCVCSEFSRSVYQVLVLAGPLHLNFAMFSVVLLVAFM